MSLITTEKLRQFFEDTDEDWLAEIVEPLNEVLSFYEINTSRRISMFLAQVGHESAGMSVMEENLNYSAQGLNKIFPKYFIRAGREANAYAKKPEKIANVVYASRMGNGPPESGDGYRYRGRGFIQLTGKSNYAAFAADMELSLEEVVPWLETAEGACWSAAWFWDSRELNKWADKGDVLTVTKKINGGTNGLEERKSNYTEALNIFV
jgi:putative chitinase